MTRARVKNGACGRAFIQPTLYTPPSGPTVGQITRLGFWQTQDYPGMNDLPEPISQEQIAGIGNVFGVDYGTTVLPTSANNFPDADANYSQLPWYDRFPALTPNIVVSSINGSFLQSPDPNVPNNNANRGKWVDEFYLELPPGCLSGNTTVQFVMERIVGRGYACMFVAQSFDPADAVFQGGYNRSNNNPVRFNYNHPGTQAYSLSQVDVNRFYIRIYAIDGSAPSSTNNAFNAAAFNWRANWRLDGGAWQQIPLDIFAANPVDAAGTLDSVCWMLDTDGDLVNSANDVIAAAPDLPADAKEVPLDAAFMAQAFSH